MKILLLVDLTPPSSLTTNFYVLLQNDIESFEKMREISLDFPRLLLRAAPNAHRKSQGWVSGFYRSTLSQGARKYKQGTKGAQPRKKGTTKGEGA